MEINYKGYHAKIIFSPRTDNFYGEILNSVDIIAFLAATPMEAIQMMQEAVDQLDFLTFK